MSVIARFEIIPVREGSMSSAIASALRALDQYPVSYRTTPTDTVIEADSADVVFESVRAAHQAIPEDRVITSLEVDEDRRRVQDMDRRVASVERALGHPAQRDRPQSGTAQVGSQQSPMPRSMQSGGPPPAQGPGQGPAGPTGGVQSPPQ